jgi:hypothetical protein
MGRAARAGDLLAVLAWAKDSIGSVASLAAVAGHHGWTVDAALSGSPGLG